MRWRAAPQTDLRIWLSSTLTGRPRVGENQCEVKLVDRQGQPIVRAEVGIAYSKRGMGHKSRAATRPGAYGIFSAVLGFPMAGVWKVEVFVRRSRRPELGVPFALSVR